MKRPVNRICAAARAGCRVRAAALRPRSAMPSFALALPTKPVGQALGSGAACFALVQAPEPLAFPRWSRAREFCCSSRALYPVTTTGVSQHRSKRPDRAGPRKSAGCRHPHRRCRGRHRFGCGYPAAAKLAAVPCGCDCTTPMPTSSPTNWRIRSRALCCLRRTREAVLSRLLQTVEDHAAWLHAKGHHPWLNGPHLTTAGWDRNSPSLPFHLVPF
jgi:hypothetical protein